MSEIKRSRDVRPAALTRRTMLKGAAAAGLVAPLSGLVEPSRVRAAVARQEGNGTTLIVGLDGSPSDLDPHSQYDYRSTMVVRAIYEGLVGLKGSATDEFEGLVAESWEANDDQSVWTFKIRPELTFQDGSPCDSAAVKASYERMLGMERGAVAVFSRFISDPAQMTTPDPATIVFDCGTPQPLFVTALVVDIWPADRQCQGGPGARRGQRLRQRLDAAQRRGNRHRRLEARLVRAGPAGDSGAERELLARLGRATTSSASSSASSQRPRRCGSSWKSGDVDIMDRFIIDFDCDRRAQAESRAHRRHLGQHRSDLLLDDRGRVRSPRPRRGRPCATPFPIKRSSTGYFNGYASRANSLDRPVSARLPGERLLLRDRPRQGERAPRQPPVFRREPS